VGGRSRLISPVLLLFSLSFIVNDDDDNDDYQTDDYDDTNAN
jgi:hypothetical protein